MMTVEQVWTRLQQSGQRPASLASLRELYRTDRKLFFALACVGVPSDAALWAVQLADLARQVRAVVQGGYSLEEQNGTHGMIRSGTERIPLESENASEVLEFLHELNGTGIKEPGRDYAGAEVSEEEVLFSLGEPECGEAERDHVARRMSAKPRLLRLDEQDRLAVVGGMPGYIYHGLRRSAAKLVQSATVMYPGLRREGRLAEGFAFCGRLRQAFDNAGQVIPAPEGMVYVVYADPDGYVFDWDWVREAPHHPGHPINTDLRFSRNPQSPAPEAVLVDVDTLPSPKPFNPRLAWYSQRGDCIFCYFSDDFAYAERINNDLTVFHSTATEEPTGFKIKNIERMLAEEIVHLKAPKIRVAIHSLLLATLHRNPRTEKAVEIYSVLIEAWWRRAGVPEPPTVELPPPQRSAPASC
jgi:hypothetical protein